MRVSQAIADIMKREGVTNLFAYPVNPLIEACAEIDIRPIIVRQERTGIHMADAVSRMTSGDTVGVFCMQGGPGVENSFGAVAQAYSECVPLVVIPGGSPRAQSWVRPRLQRDTQLPAHNEVVRARDQSRRPRRRDPPRLNSDAQRPARTRPARDTRRHVERRGP